MSIIHVKKKRAPYAQIANALLEDPRLSWKAKGILSYLLSKSSDWDVRTADLVNRSTNGIEAIYSALKELRALGYASLEVVRKDGKIHSKDWVVREHPLDLGFPDQGNQDQGFAGHSNTKLSKTKKTSIAGAMGDFGLNGNTKNGCPYSAKLVEKFSEFTIRNRLHLGKRGSTKDGWEKATLKTWEKVTRELLDQLNDDDAHYEVKLVMKWYFLHWKDEFVPKAHTMRAFCEKFSDLKAKMEKGQMPTPERGQPGLVKFVQIYIHKDGRRQKVTRFVTPSEAEVMPKEFRL